MWGRDPEITTHCSRSSFLPTPFHAHKANVAFLSHLTPGWSLSQGNKKTLFATACPQGLPVRSQWGLETGLNTGGPGGWDRYPRPLLVVQDRPASVCTQVSTRKKGSLLSGQGPSRGAASLPCLFQSPTSPGHQCLTAAQPCGTSRGVCRLERQRVRDPAPTV